MKLEKELVAASSVPLILSILSEGDSYGYAIIQRVKELSGGEIEWTDGMLYPVLHWLEDQGQVRSRWTKSEMGRRRKYYSLRRKGRLALREQKEQWSVVTSTLKHLWKPHHAVGNTVVGLGWFGGLHNYGAKSLLMLVVVVASSVLFFLVGLTPTGWLRLTKN